MQGSSRFRRLLGRLLRRCVPQGQDQKCNCATDASYVLRCSNRARFAKLARLNVACPSADGVQRIVFREHGDRRLQCGNSLKCVLFRDVDTEDDETMEPSVSMGKSNQSCLNKHLDSGNLCPRKYFGANFSPRKYFHTSFCAKKSCICFDLKISC